MGKNRKKDKRALKNFFSGNLKFRADDVVAKPRPDNFPGIDFPNFPPFPLSSFASGKNTLNIFFYYLSRMSLSLINCPQNEIPRHRAVAAKKQNYERNCKSVVVLSSW